MTGDKEGAAWPLPKFYFSVDISGVGTDLPFQEVAGLDTETQIPEYRESNSKLFSSIKVPTIAKIGYITLKKGIFVKDNGFSGWCAKIKINTINRDTITIRLLDERGKPTMVWKRANAWPNKITGVDLKSNGNEVVLEMLELAHEALTIENGH